MPSPSPRPQSRKTQHASEQTPLLQDDRSSTHSSETNYESQLENGTSPPKQDGDSPPGKPLPKLQIGLLCYARMMEPIAFFSIFPYIAQMVQRNGHLPDSDVGFYSGLIESLFSATQTVVLIFWGRLADRVGRRPMLIYSLFGMTVGPALFGLASSIWQMILFRCLAGIFSGSSLIIRTMIGDHSTPETQAVAFSWFAFAGNVGIFLGPIIGGALADPATQYPGVFGGAKFFERYPYALPGFVIGFISLTGALLSLLFLEETLEKKKKTAKTVPDGGSVVHTETLAAGDDSHGDSQDTVVNGQAVLANVINDATAESSEDDNKMTIWRLIKTPKVGLVLWLYTHVMLLAFAFTAIMPVVLFTPVNIGGLGATPVQISIYMAIQGASQALWLLLAFPLLQRRFGTKGTLKLCAAVYPVFFVGYILMNVLLRDGTQTAMAWFWILGSMVVIIGPGVSMAFTGVQLALNDVSPAPQMLGTLNAIALTCTSAMRSVVPAVATAIYAVGVRHQILWGHLAWAVLIPVSMGVSLVLRWLPDDKRR